MINAQLLPSCLKQAHSHKESSYSWQIWPINLLLNLHNVVRVIIIKVNYLVFQIKTISITIIMSLYGWESEKCRHQKKFNYFLVKMLLKISQFSIQEYGIILMFTSISKSDHTYQYHLLYHACLTVMY